MNASSPDPAPPRGSGESSRGENPGSTHQYSRLLDLVAEVDFAEQLDRAQLLIERRRDDLLNERRAAVRAAKRNEQRGGSR